MTRRKVLAQVALPLPGAPKPPTLAQAAADHLADGLREYAAREVTPPIRRRVEVRVRTFQQILEAEELDAECMLPWSRGVAP